jgi:glycerol-3-phosphate dehydrogenase
MIVRDTVGNQRLEIRSRVTVNAAGAGAGEVMRLFGAARPFPLLRAINLVTSKPASDMALAAPGRTGRMLTLVPWRGRALVGTGQSAQLAEPGSLSITAADVDAFIGDANAAFPALKLTPADVTLVHRGLVPAVVRSGRPDLKPAAEIVDHGNGAITVIGVKFTTARAVAERAIRGVGRRLGRRLSPSRTATMPLPGAAIADHEALAIETGRALHMDVPLPVIRHLIGLYAEGAADIIHLTHERPDLQALLAPGTATVKAEIVHVIRHEMALRLSDIVVRRTGLGSAGAPPAEAVQVAAQIAAAELGWDDARTAAEVADVQRFYDVG